MQNPENKQESIEQANTAHQPEKISECISSDAVTERKRQENLNIILRDLAVKLSAITELDEGLHLCLEAAIEISGMDCGGVYLVDEASGDLDMAFHKGLSSDFIRIVLRLEADSDSVRLIMRGKPVYTQHQLLGVPLDEMKKREGLRAIAVIPMLHKGRIVGCLNIASHTLREVPAWSRMVLETIAAQISGTVVRLRAEQALHESEHKFESIFDAANDGIVVAEPETRKFYTGNKMFCRMLGYSLKEIKDMGVSDIHPEEALPQVIEKFEKQSKNEFTLANDIPVKRKDGSIFYADVNSSLITLGGKTHLMGIFRDITERKRAKEIIESLAKFPSENPNPVLRISKDCTILYANDASSPVLETWGRKVGERLPDDCCKRIEEVFGSDSVFGFEFKCHNGRIFSVVLAPVVHAGYANAYGLDITERKKAEEALRESENRYKAVIDNAEECIVVVQDRKLQFVNPQAMVFLGYTEEELTSRPFIEFVHPDDQERVMEIHLKRLKGEEVPHVYEFKIVDKQGNAKWLENNGILIEWEGKSATLNFLRDITERKKAEYELKKHQYYLEKAQDIGCIGTWELDIEKNILIWTDENYRIFGVPAGAELTYEIFLDCVYPDDREYVDKKWKAALNKEPYDIEHRIIVDGEVRWVREKAELDFDDEGNCTRGIGFTQDITERKKAEQKLLDNQTKLKSLASQLTLTEESERRRIATELHDHIGQSLVFSKIKLDELHQSATSSELTKALDEICNNIGQIIRDTRSLTFDLSSPILNELGLEAAVAEWLDVQVWEKHGIETEFIDDGQQKPLDDDIRAFLFRNVRELLVNVIKHAQAHKVKVSVRRVDEHIQIDVEDDGKGFDAVKAMSTAIEDTKFGLFSIRQRLEQLGGQFEIDTEERRGSKVTMTAPLKRIKSQS